MSVLGGAARFGRTHGPSGAWLRTESRRSFPVAQRSTPTRICGSSPAREEQAHVAVAWRPGEPGRAATLPVEERQRERGLREAVPRAMVHHPGVDCDATTGSSDELERACLLRVVD